MAQRSIDELFRAITRGRSRRAPATLAEGISGSGADFGQNLSQAGAEIHQLQSVWQQQVNLITSVTNGQQSSAGQSGSSTAGNIAKDIFSGFGLLSPVISGIASLFGFGGSSAPPPLPVYVPPASVSLSGYLTAQQAAPVLNSTQVTNNAAATSSAATAQQTPAGTAQATNYSPQITVNVSAMDSQSFLDRSNDIADAVRAAMLNSHPLNSVVADL